MVLTKKFKAFDDRLLDRHPELIEFLKPRDHYPELKKILNTRIGNLPDGSLNTKVIINEGKIVERVYKTPKGKVLSLFPKPSNIFFDQAA
tara:strand:- start:472 stop:741 length:270 start_codon:yes stop_codon:yes gene_type:complete